MNIFVTVTTFVLGVAFVAVAAAHALALGRTRAKVRQYGCGRSTHAVCLLSSGKGEAFDMETASGHAGRAEVVTDRIGHRGRSAEEDIAVRGVGDELPEMLGRESCAPSPR